MTELPRLALRSSAGSRRLVFALSVGVVGVCLVLFLQRLTELQEYSEKTVVEVTIRNIRMGLQLAQGEAILHGQEGLIAAWAGRNPIHWLTNPPVNYQGDCATRVVGKGQTGRWCFDAASGELVYVPRFATELDVLRYGLRPPAEIRWRIETHRAPNGSVVAASVRKLTPYAWGAE